jgi:hypothetical protein
MNVLFFSPATPILVLLALIVGLAGPVMSVIKIIRDPFWLWRFRFWLSKFRTQQTLFHESQEFLGLMKILLQYCLETKAHDISANSCGPENDKTVYLEATWQTSGLCLCIWKSNHDQEIKMGVRLIKLHDKSFLVDEVFIYRYWSMKGPHLYYSEGCNFRRLLRIFDRSCEDYNLEC